MTETLLSAVFIDGSNLEFTRRFFSKKIVRNYPLGYEAGHVIINQTIKTPDLFNEKKEIVHETYWLITREDFDKMFDIIDDAQRTLHFAMITKK